jgi:hypothetical protein
VYIGNILYMHERGKRLCQDHKIDSVVTQCALQQCTKHLAHTYNFLKRAVSNGGSTEATCRCGRVSDVFSRLISMLVFDILQLPSGYIQICSGCSAATCILLATGLLVTLKREHAGPQLNLADFNCWATVDHFTSAI